MDEIKKTFEFYDKDQNGYISHEEAHKVILELFYTYEWVHNVYGFFLFFIHVCVHNVKDQI